MMSYKFLDKVSVPLPNSVDILMACNGKGQSSVVLVFHVIMLKSIHVTRSINSSFFNV